MSRVLTLLSVAVTIVLVAVQPTFVVAERGITPPTTTTIVHDDDNDVVGVVIGSPSTSVAPSSGGGGSNRSGGGSGGGATTTLPNDCNQGWFTIGGRINTWIDPVTGNIMAEWATGCPGILVLEVRVYRAPHPGDLIPGIYGEVLRSIAPPANNISPPDSSPVNLGLWLAVAEPHVVSRSGTVGPFDVTVTATLAETVFEMSDGAVIRCPGGGVPIADLDAVEPGPCGHVFHETDLDGSIAVSSTWSVTYETTIGNGTIPDVHTSATFPYCVYQIQTVGGSAGTESEVCPA